MKLVGDSWGQVLEMDAEDPPCQRGAPAVSGQKTGPKPRFYRSALQSGLELRGDLVGEIDFLDLDALTDLEAHERRHGGSSP